MAILNYGSYYSYKCNEATNNKNSEILKTRPAAFDKLKAEWHRKEIKCFEHRSLQPKS